MWRDNYVSWLDVYGNGWWLIKKLLQTAKDNVVRGRQPAQRYRIDQIA